MNGAVPIYDAIGRLLSFASPEWIERHAGNLRLIRSRRGVLKRAMLRADDGELVQWLAAAGKRSSFGRGFMQTLSCGRTWALKGVRGSGR
jgi:hypothetical protein